MIDRQERNVQESETGRKTIPPVVIHADFRGATEFIADNEESDF